MWVTKVDFIGSDGNSTTTIDRSNTEEWAITKYEREIDKWFIRLTKFTQPIYDSFTFTTGEMIIRRCKLKLEIINIYLKFHNEEKNCNSSFNIELYEEE